MWILSMLCCVVHTKLGDVKSIEQNLLMLCNRGFMVAVIITMFSFAVAVPQVF